MELAFPAAYLTLYWEGGAGVTHKHLPVKPQNGREPAQGL